MLTTTDEFEEVTFTGQLTYSHKEPNATAEGAPRWLPINDARVKLHRHSVTFQVRGMNGRELGRTALARTPVEQHDLVYDALQRVAHVAQDAKDRCPSTENLTIRAAHTLWLYSQCITSGEDYEAKVNPKVEPAKKADPEDD